MAVIVAQEFVEDARLSARAFGLPGLQLVIVPSTITRLQDEAIRDSIDAVIDSVAEALTSEPKREPEDSEPGLANGHRSQFEMSFQGATSLDAYWEFNRSFLERGWGDGLPLVEPTADRVERMLSGTTLAPGDTVAILPPGKGIATVEKIAINCVMAGCEPSHLPILIAAARALYQDSSNAHGWLISTGAHAPLLFISGPIADELNINYGQCTLGPGKQSRVNISLGRALRLMLINIGFNRPGELDMDTIGTANKFSLCAAENAQDSPWPAFHVDQGFSPESSVVSVIGILEQREDSDMWSRTPESCLKELAYSTASPNSFSRLMKKAPANENGIAESPARQSAQLPGGLFVMMGPEHAEIFERHSWTRTDVKKYLWENQKVPVTWLTNMAEMLPEHQIVPDWKETLGTSEHARGEVLVPCQNGPDNYHITVVGGPVGKTLAFTCQGISMMEITDRQPSI